MITKVIAPAGVDARVTAETLKVAKEAVACLPASGNAKNGGNYGVFGVELFLLDDNKVSMCLYCS